LVDSELEQLHIGQVELEIAGLNSPEIVKVPPGFHDADARMPKHP
jgi:hypothetical protein